MLGKFITHCEDSLTASVFTHLLHLPTELFWRILRNACYMDSLPEHAGDILAVEAWPSWKSQGTNNPMRVIPDVFMRFTDFDLIIEAKRWDDMMQYRSQWERELVAYTNEYGDEKRPVKMIAVGGIHTHQDDALTHQWASATTEAGAEVIDTHHFVCPVHMCRWSSLLLECQRMERELKGMKYKSSQSRAHLRILENLIDLFAWHDYQSVKWFADIVPDLPQLGPSMHSLQTILRLPNH